MCKLEDNIKRCIVQLEVEVVDWVLVVACRNLWEIGLNTAVDCFNETKFGIS